MIIGYNTARAKPIVGGYRKKKNKTISVDTMDHVIARNVSVSNTASGAIQNTVLEIIAVKTMTTYGWVSYRSRNKSRGVQEAHKHI